MDEGSFCTSPGNSVVNASIVVAVLLGCTTVAPARAQDPPAGVPAADRGWEIAIDLGGTNGGRDVQGTGTLPADPAPFVVRVPVAPFTYTVPHFPSWYFAGGAAYLNRAGQPARFPVTGLDPVLTTASARRQRGGHVGLTLRRRLSPRVGMEASVRYGLGRLALPDETLDRVESSRETVGRFFDLIPFLDGVSSTAAIREAAGREIATTGSAVYDFTRARTVPFVSVGGGVVARVGGAPSVTMRGRYMTRAPLGLPPQFPFVEIVQTDTVDVRYGLTRLAPMLSAGVGVRRMLSDRLTARAGLLVLATRDRMTISIGTATTTGTTIPGVQASSTFAIIDGSTRPPTVTEFTLNSDPSEPSSLSGPPLRDVATFDGRGWVTRVALAAGIGWRF